jgi:hypothetical protein
LGPSGETIIKIAISHVRLVPMYGRRERGRQSLSTVMCRRTGPSGERSRLANAGRQQWRATMMYRRLAAEPLACAGYRERASEPLLFCRVLRSHLVHDMCDGRSPFVKMICAPSVGLQQCSIPDDLPQGGGSIFYRARGRSIRHVSMTWRPGQTRGGKRGLLV